MKKVFCFLSFFVAEFLFADVLSNRYDDQTMHQGLPGWVSLADGHALSSRVDEFEINEKSDIKFAKVVFPDDFVVECVGKKYKSMIVYDNGKIEFGDGENIYEKAPYIKTSSLADRDYSLGNTFEWGIYSQELDGGSDVFLVVNYGPFKLRSGKSYSIQTLIFQNGEVQVQYWKHDNPSSVYEDWMYATFFDGYGSESSQYNAASLSYMDIYGKDGLRPGWVAKALNSEYSVNITEPQKGAGLLVQMNSNHPDLGGIVAYDYSREHPVVGSISSVEVSASNMPSEEISNLYCWYFDEYYKTFDAHYPRYLTNNVSQITLKKDDFYYTWDAYKTDPYKKEKFLRTDETIDFIGAPAFKFQRTSSYYKSQYDFYITKIRYNLAQPASIQFLPLKSQYQLTVVNSFGGIIELVGLNGVPDIYNAEKKIYKLYRGQSINGSITAAPGYFIDKVMVSYMWNGVQQGTVYANDAFLSTHSGNLNFSEDLPKQKISIKGKSIYSHLVITVTYKKCESRGLDPVIPNIVITEKYTAPQTAKENRISSSALIFDAFGGVAQKQKKIVDGEYAVSSVYSNKLNQVTRVPMTFVHKAQKKDFEYVDMACEGCITEANAYYYNRSLTDQSNSTPTEDDIDRPDAFNNAFSEMKYYYGSEENGAVSASAGIAKRSFAYNGDSYSKNWEMPASSEYDYIPHSALDENSLANAFAARNFNLSLQDFVLKISRDSEGKFKQQIYNSKGMVVSSWFFDGTHEQVYIHEYDDYGNLKRVYNKSYSSTGTQKTYDAQNRVDSIKSFDNGLTVNSYDSYGRLRFVKTSRHADDCFSAIFYDELGRLTAVGELSNMSADDFKNPDMAVPESKIRYISKTIYGKPLIDDMVALGINQTLAQSILSKMQNIRPNDIGAVISYDNDEKMSSVKISEYNRIGEKQYQWILFGIAGAPVIQLNYEYNLSGEMTKSVFSQWNGSKWVDVTTRTRSYGDHGRLESTSENGSLLAEYSYTKNGNISEKTYYDMDKVVLRKVIFRDVYERPNKIAYFDNDGNELYSTTLQFKSEETNQVEKASHEWKSQGIGEISKSHSYGYDYSDRLTSVTGDLSASYGYDALGRIVKKIEGDSTIGFAYGLPSFLPTGVNINGRSPAASAVYLKYDASGNLWYDRHNQIVYRNNESGQPIKAYKFSSIPTDITEDDVRNNSSILNGAVQVISMAYDEGGNRIWYAVEDRDGGASYAVMTVPGVGVYEMSKANGSDVTFNLLRRDLVAGGFRDGSGVAYFPVTDAQGNIRGYATTAGLESAYDYYPYGTSVDLAVKGTDDNRRWQGKEYDGEQAKYYFGARYFDPFFGLWMSPDPAGQFMNPYTYGGDPVNYVDPNGEAIFTAAVLVGAAIGAVIGGSAAAYQCSKYGTSGCSSAVGAGATIGAVAGAVGAGVAGAAGGLSATAVGEVGLATESGVLAASAGAAVEGGLAGAASGAASYATMAAWGMTNGWDWGDFWGTTFGGLGKGALMGGITGAVSYGLSDSYQWETHEKVLEYGKKMADKHADREYILKMGEYVKNVEGKGYDIAWFDAENGMGTSAGNKMVGINWSTGLDEQGEFSASRFYSSIVHENGHLQDQFGNGRISQLYKDASNPAYGVQSNEYQTHYNSVREIHAIRYELSHKYFQYWSRETQNYAKGRLIRSYFGLSLNY